MFKPQELIKQAVDRHGDHVAVSCSFGKDSIVVLHMALQIKPDIKVVFADTGIEFPETIKYKNKLVDEWNLHIFESKPIKSFWDCIKEYGFPLHRGKGNQRTPKCCIYLKEKPLANLERDIGVNAVFTGLMASESRQRMMVVQRFDNGNAPHMWHDDVEFCGQRWYSRHDGIWKYHPIAYWSDQDVLDYHEQHSIPLNPAYTKWEGVYSRTGCLPCPCYLDWEHHLSRSHPKLYLMMKKLQEPDQTRLTA